MYQPFFPQFHSTIPSENRLLIYQPFTDLNQQYVQGVAEIQQLKAYLDFKEHQLRYQIQTDHFLQRLQNDHTLNPIKVATLQADKAVFKTQFQNTENRFSEESTTENNETPSLMDEAEGPQDNCQDLQMQKMLLFFIERFENQKNHNEISKQRQKYASNQPLLALFDALREKYSAAAKCREDMLRFALRKTLTYLRNSLRDKHHLSVKAASLLLCKKYFTTRLDKMMKEEGINLLNEEEVLSFLLPYKKNSRNSTTNTRFIREIFASEEFCVDYQEFLSNMNEIYESDNQKKISKFVDFLGKCMKEKDIRKKVMGFKRLPWLNTWLDSTKAISYELLNMNKPGITHKRIKGGN